MSDTTDRLTDERIRELVLLRLEMLSPDTIKSIGQEGTFTKMELIEHVKAGDRVGEIVAQVELEWLRAMKSGFVNALLAGDGV
jgi:hypothetical protein